MSEIGVKLAPQKGTDVLQNFLIRQDLELENAQNNYCLRKPEFIPCQLKVPSEYMQSVFALSSVRIILR